jgi:hypothetical protein
MVHVIILKCDTDVSKGMFHWCEGMLPPIVFLREFNLLMYVTVCMLSVNSCYQCCKVRMIPML